MISPIHRLLHARRHPCFAHEGETIGTFAGDARMRKFQHQLAVLPFVDGDKQPAVASVGQHLVENEIVDGVAGRWQLQDGKGFDRMGEFVAVCRRQVHDVEHQSGHVVAAAGGQRRVHQRARGLLRRSALVEQHLQAVVVEHAVNAVAADQQSIVLPQADRGIVDAREILEADGAVEHVGEVAASCDVILGQPLQTALAQTVGACVADVNDVTGAARQDHRRERAAHAAEPGIDAALRIDPAIGGFQRPRGDAPDAQRFGQGIVGVEKTTHGQFGGFPSALVAADAVSHGGNDVAVEHAGLTEAGRDVVFVGRLACRSR